jgi:hypothetical protein
MDAVERPSIMVTDDVGIKAAISTRIHSFLRKSVDQRRAGAAVVIALGAILIVAAAA